MVVGQMNKIDQKLQAIVDQEIRKKHTHSVLLAVQTDDGQVNFKGAAGTADADQQKPLRTDSPFFVASITKLLTTTSILNLQDRGSLHLDDPIAKHLPQSMIQGIHTHNGTDYGQRLTIYQLLSQTSGLADYFEDKLPGEKSMVERLIAGEDMEWDVLEAMEITRNLTPKFAPNPEKMHYSDSNFRLLGAIVEAVSGKTLEENYAEYVLEPLGLQQTYLYDYRKSQGEEPAPFYYQDHLMQIPRAMSSFRADGSIVSTLDETLTFTKAFASGKLFDPAHFSRLTARWNLMVPPMIYYGGGMMRMKMPRIFTPFRALPEMIGHAGSNSSVAFHSREAGITIVGTLYQVDAPARSFRMMLNVLNTVLRR
ncbi:MAG: beta-lactamase family protein [Anaerolineae bacterium]|nr:beta-lactamase family protein [Anaerolineae bacterium]